VLFAELAALDALEKLASEAAIVHLERGLKAFALAEQADPATRARLLVMLAEALHLAGDVTRSKSVAAQGADEARFSGCAKLVAKAALWRAALPRAGVGGPLAGQLPDQAPGGGAGAGGGLPAPVL